MISQNLFLKVLLMRDLYHSYNLYKLRSFPSYLYQEAQIQTC
jgi:hypothetical protein